MTPASPFRSRTFVRDRRTWIATLVSGVALWIGTGAWLNRHVPISTRKAPATAEDGRLVTIAFDRIVRTPDGRHLDGLAFNDALRTLARAGWQAVTLAEVHAAYAGGGRLPAKPFLLTFDEGYLSTYEAVNPILRELHWPAVMFLRTERQERRDVSFLFWDRLRRMVQSGLWTVASGDPSESDPARAAGTLPAEPPGTGRIASELGHQAVTAWAPRREDPLSALGCEDAPRRDVPWLGFADDPAGAASPDGNPFRIPRLRVAASWTAAELAARMDRAVASPPAASPAGRPAALGDRWIPGAGTVTSDGPWLRLAGQPRAEIWIPAARWVDDWRLEARVVPGEGEFWIVQPDEDGRREWRIGAAGGRLYVEARTPGLPPEVLARTGGAGAKLRPHTVALVKRGRGIRAFWDGIPITSGPIALPSRWRGKVGLVAYSRSGTTSLAVSDARFSAYPYRVREISASPDAEAVQGLARDAESIAAISPPWASVDGGLLRESTIDRDLLRILSRRFAWDVLPRVVARGSAPGDPELWAATLAARAAAERFDGLTLQIESGSGEAAQHAWSQASDAAAKALRRSGMRLLVTTHETTR